MKPITKKVINNFLEKIKKTLDDERKIKYNIERLQKNHDYSMPIVIHNIMRMLLINEEEEVSLISDLKQFGIEVENSEFRTIYLKVPREFAKGESVEYKELKHSVRMIALDILDKFYNNYGLVFTDGIVFILKAKDGKFTKDIDTILYEIIKSVEKILSIKIMIGVSNKYTNYIDLHASYQDTQRAIAHSKLLNVGKIIHVDELVEGNTTNFFLSEREVKGLEQVIKLGSKEEVTEYIDKLKSKIENIETPLDLQYFYINVANILIHYAKDSNVDMIEIYKGNFIEKLLGFKDVYAMLQWINDVIFSIRELNITKRIKKSERILKNALTYIDMHYSNPDIYLEGVCDEIKVSVSYLSMLLKRDRKTTFTKYLISVRMEKAKELLRLTNDKIIDISMKCGYNEVYYFSHSFKKYTGVSPKDFRLNEEV